MKKVIIVTGWASGLGCEITKALLASGHEVIGIDLNSPVSAEPPVPTVRYLDTVADPQAWSFIAEDLRGHYSDNFGEDALLQIDGIINCAGVNSNDWFENVTLEELWRVMGVNAYSMVYGTQEFLEELTASKGFVLNIVSNAASMPMTSSLAYNMSKAAALMATKQMAHELTPRFGITVFSISPNKLAGTGMSKQIEANVIKTRNWTPEYAAEYQKKALMHGLETDPAVLASFIANLIDSGAWKFASGTDIPFGK